MRIARIVNAIVGAIWLFAVLLTIAKYTGGAGVPSLLTVLPFAMAFFVYRTAVNSWVRWMALVTNALWTLLGVFISASALLGMLGIQYFWMAAPVLTIAVTVFAIIVPCSLNTVALWRVARGGSTVLSRPNPSLERP